MRDVIAELKALRLHGMAQAWAELTAQGTLASVESSAWLIEHLLQAEGTDRAMRSIRYQMHAAKFPLHRDLASFDFAASKVDRVLVGTLATMNFTAAAHNNVVFVGGPGTGKTHLATALGGPASRSMASGCGSTRRWIWSMRWSGRRRKARRDALR